MAEGVPSPRSSLPSSQQRGRKKGPRVAVIGAGWGGLGAAKALCEAGAEVTLLDALPDPSGATPYLTPTGKPFEAGHRGFWKDYPNLNALVGELGLAESECFTPFLPSAFYSPEGLEATAPVFGDAPALPSPLGQVLATFENFERMPLSDRATMAGLLLAVIDFTRDEKTFEAYDRMTAHELFVRCGLSQRLVDDFLRPTLLVGLFKPPEELSAAVAMELLYFYALAHQTSFDVRWIRRGSVAETLAAPLTRRLVQDHGLDIRGKCRVTGLGLDPATGRVEHAAFTSDKGEEKLAVDAVVLAVGSKGMRAVVSGSPELARRAPLLTRAASLGAIDVLSVRLWLDAYVPTKTPANVWSRFGQLRGSGGTFFMLDQLQGGSPADEARLWGGEEPRGSVVACDFYNSGAVACLSDADIVDTLMRELLPAAVPAFRTATVVDSHVARYPGAVTLFSPGSYTSRPTLDVPGVPNLACAGDWVRMGDREHGAKGLCQERAYVSGLHAANGLLKAMGGDPGQAHPVLPVRDDEPQVVLGRQVNAAAASFLESLGLQASPWVR